uniref:Uncharacterized protein n=1 Tax=Magallana gigas TaxID=29159 RepID=A0A8W8IR43_MAGGI
MILSSVNFVKTSSRQPKSHFDFSDFIIGKIKEEQEFNDRCFVLHPVSNGSVFIQPYHHKGFYLHHLDKALSVRKLEINWRPPEEYFFSVGIVDVPDPDVFVAPEDAPVQKSTPFIEESSPVKPSLFWGCFGGKSKKLSSKIKKTIKQNSRV